MSYWNAKYTNEDGEYEITFASKNYHKAKAVEKVCCAVIDDKVDTPDDIEVVVHGRWEEWWPGISVIMTGEEMLYRCSACTAKYADIDGYDYCPNCGARMDGGEEDG